MGPKSNTATTDNAPAPQVTGAGITEATKHSYRCRARALMDHYARTLPSDLGYDGLVSWLASRQTEIGYATFRQYRAALVFFLAEQNDPAATAAAARLRALPGIGARKGTGTSAHKAKGFRRRRRVVVRDGQRLVTYQDDLTALLHALATTRSSWRDRLRDWIIAGIETGLRPAEWEDAVVVDIDAHSFLVVRNRKATNGRGNGIDRVLELTALRPEKLAAIRRHVDAIGTARELGEGFRHYYTSARRALYDVVQSLPAEAQHITLYTTRHQFAANAKAVQADGSRLSQREVADLLGHYSERTAGRHYGRTARGRVTIRFVPREHFVALRDRQLPLFRNRWFDVESAAFE